jgi:DNA-binding PadR family transcriptional regulator
MNNEKLITLQKAADSRKGRPKKYVTCTALGFEFLKTYRRLKMQSLRGRKEDFEHATKDALYAGRLVERGHSPFQIFMELNSIARNLKVSSQTFETV